MPNRMKKLFLSTFLFFANIAILFADDPGGGTPSNPCGGSDIDGPTGTPTDCPIDTWIMVFAALALIITILYLHKKQQNAAKLCNN